MPGRMITGRTPICDRVIEAGWLVALVATPVFFNSASFRSFEPDKIALLRSIALVMAATWAIKGIEIFAWRRAGGDRPEPAWRRSPWEGAVLLAAALILLAHAVATAVSISPPLSLWGSYHRLQGVFSLAAYLVVFLSMAALLRSREQVERVVTAMLISSSAIALYGLIQHYGLDPMTWSQLGQRAVMSTMGNAIFLAAFLIMAAPLALARLVGATSILAGRCAASGKAAVRAGCLASVLVCLGAWWVSATAGGLATLAVVGLWLALGLRLRWPPRASLALAVYAVVLSILLAAILLSQSRGPFLGLLTSLFFFALLYAVARRSWAWPPLLTGAAAVGLLVLLLINTPNSPVAFVQELPVVGRLTRVLETGRTARVRLLLWQQSVDAIGADPLRALVGYGPETIRLALAPHYSAELGAVESRDALPDRAHNQTFDVLLTTGLLGLVAYYGLVLAIFCLGLRRLGAIGSWRGAAAFATTCLASAAGLALLTRIFDGSWRLLGVGLSLGLLAGAVGFLTGLAVRRRGAPAEADAPEANTPEANTPEEIGWGGLAIVAFLSALAGHFVEIHVGIATASTLGTFWAFTALCLSVAWLSRQPRPETPEPPGPAASARRLRSGMAMVSLVIVTLAFDFSVSGLSLFANPGFAVLFAVTCVIAGLVLLVEAWPFDGTARGGYALAAFLGLYASACLASFLAARLIFAAPLPAGLGLHPKLGWYALAVLGFIAILALAVAPPMRSWRRPAVRLRGLCTPVIFALAVALAWTTNFEVVQADIHFKQGWMAQRRERDLAGAARGYRRAMELAPEQYYYSAHLGRALSEQAVASNDPEARQALFAQADAVLRAAGGLDAYDPDRAANLARLHWAWGRSIDDAAARIEHIKTAIGLYEQSIALSPRRPKLWNELGQAQVLIGEHEPALAKFQHALALDPAFPETYQSLGKLYVALNNWPLARDMFERAVELGAETANLRRGLGFAYGQMGLFDKSAANFEAALGHDPSHPATRRNLILIYQRMGNCDAARAQLRDSLAVLPDDEAIRNLAELVERSC